MLPKKFAVCIPRTNQLRSPFLAPPFLVQDILRVIKFGVTLTFVAYDDDASTTAIKIPGCERADAAQTSEAKINCMGGSLRQIRRCGPLHGRCDYLVANRPSDGG